MTYNSQKITKVELLQILNKKPQVAKINNKKTYIHMNLSFDIETYKGCMYIWQLSIFDDVIYGRYWDDFLYLLNMIIKVHKLTPTKRTLIWVHNLSYEFQWLKNILSIEYRNEYDSGVFAKQKRKILKCTHKQCIDFMDSYAITQCSLEQVPKRYNIPIEKLVGNLDYSIPRNHLTVLSDKELSYCINDVKILSHFSQWYYDNYLTRKLVPMTATAIILQDKKDIIDNTIGLKKWKYIIKSVFPDEDFYNILMYAFRGGYVHSNIQHTATILFNILSYDITSSYPYTMLLFNRFPLGKFTFVSGDKDFDHHIKEKHCVIMVVKFINIKNKTPHSIESSSKVTGLKNAIIDNGRILSASSFSTVLTDLDYEIYQDYYQWDDMQVLQYYYCEITGYLPKVITSTLCHNYEQKNALKKAGKPYAIEKSKVNSEYGACVKKRHKEILKFDSESHNIYVDDEINTFEKFVESQILLPQWGVYISSYSRYRLLKALKNIGKNGNDGVYCDTDSIKFLNKENEKYFIEQNKLIQKQNKLMCERLNLDYNIFYDLGCWDNEAGKGYPRFKTLGAKRYIYEENNGTFHQTVAGLPKNTMIETYKNIDTCFEKFSDEMYIAVSGKLTPHYIDEPFTETIIDNQGHKETITELSGQRLEDTDFTLKMNDLYLNLIKKLGGEVF